MTQKLFAIYDTKAAYFMSPWPCRNEGIAKREFASACSNSESAMGKFPADYVLHEVGEYNDIDASVKSSTPAIRIADGVEILQLAAGASK